jgi:hypothetical protein
MKSYMNDDGVTMTAHLAFDPWNVDAVGYCVDGRGHSNHVGHVHGHDLFFHNHVHGREYSRVRRDHGRCREYGRGHSLFGPSYRARNAWGHIVCRRDDNRLVLASPSRSERDRVSPYSEDDNQVGKCRGMVDGYGEEGICEESADGDSGEGRSQAWVEVEEWKTLTALFVPCFSSMSARPTLYPLASLSQFHSTPSAQDSIPRHVEDDLRAYGCKLIHQAGILLNQCVSFYLWPLLPPHSRRQKASCSSHGPDSPPEVLLC